MNPTTRATIEPDEARLETMSRVHPADAAVAGQILYTSLQLGRSVHAGDIIVELDSRTQQLDRIEKRARLAALAPQLTKISGEIAQENQALAEARKAGQISLQQAQARKIGAARAAAIAADIAERFYRLVQAHVGATVQYLRALSEAQQAQATADAARWRFNGSKEICAQTKLTDRPIWPNLIVRATQLEGERSIRGATAGRETFSAPCRYQGPY